MSTARHELTDELENGLIALGNAPADARAYADRLVDAVLAEVLREAADVADEIGSALVADALPSAGTGAYDVMEELRRMAEGGEGA